MVQDIRICFVGESFVNGTGDRTYLGWTGRLCADLAQQGHLVTHYNLGIRRETSTELLARWQPECDRRLPAGCDNRIVFCFGVNDTTLASGTTRVELEQSIQNAQQILKVAQENYAVLMISPAAISDSNQNSRIQTLSQRFAQLCGELNIPYLDIFTPLSQSEIWLQEVAAGDRYHPDAGGYAEFAQIVQNWSVWKHWFTA